MHASTFVRVPFCGLPCSPLRIDVTGAGAWRVAGGCGVARAAASWAAPEDAIAGPDPAHESGQAVARIDGRPADIGTALTRAASLLAAARRPHVFGLAWSTIGTARRAARLARRLGATIDIESGAASAAESEAIAIAGLTGATFGAVRARADVVLLWRCDPRPEHPDLLPARLPAAAGGGARRFVRLGAVGFSEPGDLEALAALRALIRGRAPHLATVVDGASAGGIPVGALREAAAALASARHAAIVWDAGAVRGATGAAAALALALLARDLDDAPNVARAGDETASRPVIGRPRPVASGRRAVARPLGCGGNVAGALAALSSELGHARDLGPGGAADAVLLVGARVIGGREGGARTDDAGAGAPPAARPRVVLIGARVPDGLVAPDVFLPAAVPGLSGGGLWMRADGIAVPVLEALPRVVPLEEEILDALLARAAGTTP